MTFRRIVIIGGGAFGSSLAINLSGKRQIHWVIRSQADAEEISGSRINSRYLPGFRVPNAVRIFTDLAEAMDVTDIVIVATPASTFESVVSAIAKIRSDLPVIWGCKGFCPHSGEPLSVLAAKILGSEGCYGVVSGPGFAEGLANGDPTALVVATNSGNHDSLAIAAGLSNDSLRVYANSDLVGVQICGAIKNVYAIAAGIIDGCGWGVKTRAAMMTRAIAEAKIFLKAHKAKRSTLMGLSGFGDFYLTCGSRQSRNYQIGMALASGIPLPEALITVGHVAEGVETARLICKRAGSLGIEMPIAAAVNEILDGRKTPRECAMGLMARSIKHEKSKLKSMQAAVGRSPDLV